MTPNDCTTLGAAAYVPFPAWLAVIEQVPAATAVTVFPDTVQIPVVEDAKLTDKPEDADADKFVVVPTVFAEGCMNVMV